uniref:Reverse transcriptase n=1 Tax=Quercus lobata TaxID=97700 RepID=A0A7N2LWE8_QUELO
MSNTGEWVHDESEVKEVIRNGFAKLYSTSLCSAPRHIQSDSTWHACITDEDRDNLDAEVTDEEIRAGLWSLKAFKAPGPDGLHAGFFQRFWLVVGRSVMEEVKKIFLLKEVPEVLNSTLISLIPKIPGLETLNNYCPISLCNMVYKIVSKVVMEEKRLAYGEIDAKVIGAPEDVKVNHYEVS